MMGRISLPSRVFNDRRIRGSHLRVLAAIAILNAGTLSHRQISAECGICDRDLRRDLRELSDYGYLTAHHVDGKETTYIIEYNDIEGGGEITPAGEKIFTLTVPPPDAPLPFPPDPKTLPPLTPPSDVKGARARASRLPEDWFPTDANAAYAASKGFVGEKLSRQIEDFRDYWHARAGPNALKLDWSKTWATWIRKSADYQATRGQHGSTRAGAVDNLIEGFGRAVGLGERPADCGADRPASGPLLDGEYVRYDA